MRYALIVTLMLAGCAKETLGPPVAEIAKPVAELMQPCPQQIDIPKCEADKKCRADYYANSRARYGQCSDKVAGLQSYVSVVANR